MILINSSGMITALSLWLIFFFKFFFQNEGGKYDFRYIFVEADNQRQPIIVLDNRWFHLQ